MLMTPSFLAPLLLLLAPVSAFRPANHGAGVNSYRSNRQIEARPTPTLPRLPGKSTQIDLSPEINEIVQISVPNSVTLLVAAESESWRQYVPLVVSVGVIIDILLGSPLANVALGPMRRASEKGATGDSKDGEGGNNGAGGGSLFSSLGGMGGANVNVNKSKERVDSEAIAQAAIDKARNTLELKRFLEENKTNEQRYDEMRRKIDKQMDELD